MSALLTAADTRATASEAMTAAAQASLVEAEQSVVRLKEKLEFAFTERSQVAEQHRQYVLFFFSFPRPHRRLTLTIPPAANELIRRCGVA
jgi:transposase-like protein